MIEPYLQKITPKQFFISIGVVIGLVAISAIILIAVLIMTNFNFLNWME